jgi:hypothetical protein
MPLSVRRTRHVSVQDGRVSSRTLGIAVLYAIVMISATGCFGGGAQLVLTSEEVNEVSVQLPAKPQQSWVHGSYPLCLDEPGKVRVTDVRFQEGDLDIVDWAMQHAPVPDEDGKRMFAGDLPGTFESRGIEDVGVLELECDGQYSYYELVLELKAGETSSEGDGVIVRYISDGEQGAVAIPEQVVMCVRPEEPSCM